MIPVIDVAVAVGWRDGQRPQAASGLRVDAFATGLDHPRWLHVLPNGDVLVAETNGPPRTGGGVRGWFFKQFQKRAGGAVPSPDRITLLRDVDGDGIADRRDAFLVDIPSPFGMALVGDTLWVATAGSVLGVGYTAHSTVAAGPRVKLLDLPGGPRNHHWTKSLIASGDGRFLYAGVGSNSDHGEHGMGEEAGRAAIWEIDLQAHTGRILASGLRNPVGMSWVPGSDALWVVVNERDELGGDLVPDFLTAVRDGGFYGWPYSYYGTHRDPRIERRDAAPRDVAIVPDYALGPHTASLGLAWSGAVALPAPYRDGMFVGQHGSWNRRPPSGYKVVFIPFRDGRPDGAALDVLSGFLTPDGDARGRPVGVAIDSTGALLVADDVGNTIWRVSAAVAPTGDATTGVQVHKGGSTP